jgi:hypothetical protein
MQIMCHLVRLVEAPGIHYIITLKFSLVNVLLFGINYIIKSYDGRRRLSGYPINSLKQRRSVDL